MSSGQQIGVVIAIVQDVNDPEDIGRVQLRFPWLSEDATSSWARVVRAMAGSGRGEWFMPEVGDEVLVAFEHGDFQHPYVVGFLWSTQDKPPKDGIDTKVRRLKTVSGHILEFDDRSGQELIRIKTQGGQQIEMKDTPAGITVSTTGGQQIEFKDAPATITLKTSAGNQVTISDAPPGLQLMVSAGTVSITCLSATITASSTLTVNAPMTMFNGVVQTQALISQAVISTAYTPGAGNIW